MWTKAKNGNIYSAKRFMRNTRYWAQIGGWLFFFSTIGGSTYLFYPDIFPDIFQFSTTSDIDYSIAGSVGSCTNTNVDSSGYLTLDTANSPCTLYTSYPSWC